MKSDFQIMGIRFLGFVILCYVAIACLQFSVILSALHIALSLLTKILPIMGLVFILMMLTNLFVCPETLTKYVGKTSGPKRWVVAILGGIISTGPIYLWYALLKELIKKGMSRGIIAAFLYARAIKPFLLPLMVFYFGWKYTVILTIVMIVVSLLQGLLVEKIMGE